MLFPAPQQSFAQGAAGVAPSGTGSERKALRFVRFRSALRAGDAIGDIKAGNACGSPMLLSMNARTEQAVLGPVSRVVREEFLRAGYRDPVRVQRGVFDSDDDSPAEDTLLLGGMLEEFRTSYCSSSGGAGTNGSVQLKVRWELYDPAKRKVVHAIATEGTYRTNGEEAMREGEFFGMAYRNAVRNLLADEGFRNSVVLAPQSAAGAGVASAPKSESLALRAAAPMGGTLSSNLTAIRAAVVTVKHAGASGSGFFVSENGYVVTNSHVVRGNRFVSVVLVTGRELVGEVMREDAGRDVALIKTEGSNFAALAVNMHEVNVGEEVTAIGSPLGEALSGTVTRGIVSAYRTIKGSRYIQSDVPILPGSSGGPLLDQSGRVIGIAVSALGTSRINFFIPIQDALGSLGVTLAAR